jgi:CarD family transcriptional regulator
MGVEMFPLPWAAGMRLLMDMKRRRRAPVRASKRAGSEMAEMATAEQQFAVSEGDYVVYPAHGVGKVQGVETQEISGMSLELIVIRFDQDRMTVRLPVTKAKTAGLRKLSSRNVMDSAISTLKTRSRAKKTMWSRRAQEYETKISSGDPVAIAEVVRDLYRGEDQGEQSYSERQMYQSALQRLAREYAAMEGTDEENAAYQLEAIIRAKRGQTAASA